MPAFLIGLAGPHIKIAGAIFLDRVISATLVGYDNLTPALQFTQLDEGYTSHHDRCVIHLVHTLRALKKCLDKLTAEYSSMEEGDLHTFETPTGTLPAPHFRSFTSLKNIKYTLKYCSHLLNKSREPRSVFLAEATSDLGSVPCVVKLTDRYDKDAHVSMEKISMAAGLLYCSWEDSVDLVVVITKYYDCSMEAPLSDGALQQLKTGLKTLHGQNLVHGDLWRPNILIDEEGCVKLIDFEWSGKVGVVRYPALLNPEIPWPEGVEVGGLIQSEHDQFKWRYTRSNEMRVTECRLSI